MPIITLELIEDTNQQPLEATVIQALVNELGDLFDSQVGGTWIKLRYLPRTRYAENTGTGAESNALNSTVRPTFVEVLKRDADTCDQKETRAQEAARIAAIVARHLDRPVNNTHVIYAPAGAGRVAFGGELIPYSE